MYPRQTTFCHIPCLGSSKINLPTDYKSTFLAMSLNENVEYMLIKRKDVPILTASSVLGINLAKNLCSHNKILLVSNYNFMDKSRYQDTQQKK